MFTFAEIVGKSKIQKLKAEHDEEIRIGNEHLKKAEALEDQIVNEVFSTYINKDKRDNLIKQAKAFSFSNEKLHRIEEAFDDFNEDKINYNVAIDILDASTHIKEYNKESFLTSISNLVINNDD